MQQIELKKLVRKNIFNLKQYSSARDEFSDSDGIFLDANENPFGKLNRYPDPYQKKLKQTISKIKSIGVENIFVGNGSDEIIDLTVRIFCNPKVDKAIIFTPTYGMYEVVAEINETEIIKIPLTEKFQIDRNQFAKYVNDSKVKLVFICSPNNPTGNCLDGIEYILSQFKGIVIVDEAYIDFCNEPSLIKKVKKNPNLIVMQTLSKAYGLASTRIGIAYCNKEIIKLFNKVKPPYNISETNQMDAILALENAELFIKNKKNILKQKKWLIQNLKTIPIIKKIFPSDANFLLVETENANKIYSALLHKKIIVRNRNSMIKNCLRITVGKASENQILVDELKNIKL